MSSGLMVLAGVWVIAAVGIAAAIAHLVSPNEIMVRLIAAFGAGVVYAILKTRQARVRFVAKGTGEDITAVVPFAMGFAVGIIGLGLELLVGLIPIPSIVSCIVIFALAFVPWYLRRPPSLKLYDIVPHIQFSRSLLDLAAPNAPCSISWRGRAYSADATLASGVRIQCRADIGPGGSWFELFADPAAGAVWRHPQPRLVLDFVSLEHLATPQGPRVRATNSHPQASTKNLVDALNIAANACR